MKTEHYATMRRCLTEAGIPVGHAEEVLDAVSGEFEEYVRLKDETEKAAQRMAAAAEDFGLLVGKAQVAFAHLSARAHIAYLDILRRGSGQ